MKKNIKKISIAVCLVAGLAVLFTGCGYYNEKLTGQDTTYAVMSNGGSAVQYGDYVYFINGTDPGFNDAAGDANVWGEVEKGGIYRAKLEGGKTAQLTDSDGVGYKDYIREGLEGKDITVKTVEKTNFAGDDKKITIIDSESVKRVVPKYVTFSNDPKSGIFIYDGWIYYSSPANRKNKTGTVEFTLSDFFRTKVDGQGTQLLYTSAKAVTAFNFYHYNNLVYLVVHEGEDLISLPISNRKAGRRVTLTDGITEVMFPRKEAYYPGINEDTASDYVYYTRAVAADDASKLGNVFERRRPDLSLDTSLRIGDNNNTYSPVSCDGDVLFFYETKAGQTAKTLIAQIIEYVEFEETEIDSKGKEKTVKVTSPVSKERKEVIFPVTESMTQVIPFAGVKTDAGINSFYAIAVEGTQLNLYQGKGVAKVTLGNNSDGISVYKIYGGRVYFTLGSSPLYSASAFAPGAIQPLTKSNIYTGNNFTFDIAGSLIWFLGDSLYQKDFTFELRSETISANYMYIKQLLNYSADEYFIGAVGENELPEVEEE